jgi:peptidoglycan/LPS O-acetylase OafA/YrhL
MSPLWSLPLELQMYVVLPFAPRLLAGRPLSGLAWGLWGAGVLLALAQPYLPARLSVLRFAPCFLAGVLAYTRLRHVTPTWAAAGWPALLLGMTGLYVLCAPWTGQVHPAWMGWLYCLIIALALPHFVSIGKGWLQRGSHEIAKYSYGVYLFHMVALWFGFGPTAPWGLGPVAGGLVALAIAVLAPVLSFHLVEKPMIDVGTRLAGAWFPAPPRARPASP